MNYQDTFSLVAKLTSVWIFISLTVSCLWPLHQLDVKNVFLNDILDEEVPWSNHMILLLRESQRRFARWI